MEEQPGLCKSASYEFHSDLKKPSLSQVSHLHKTQSSCKAQLKLWSADRILFLLGALSYNFVSYKKVSKVVFISIRSFEKTEIKLYSVWFRGMLVGLYIFNAFG